MGNDHETVRDSDPPRPLTTATMTIEAIILAGGEGVRMRSALPKSLHPVGGRAMLMHILDAVAALQPAQIHVVVSARRGFEVRAAIEDGASRLAEPRIAGRIAWAAQDKPRGTGHAASVAMPAVGRAATVLAVYGDTPLIGAATLRRLLDAAAGGRFGLLTVNADNPAGAAGLGRILRGDGGRVVRIVEEKDATCAQKRIRECNAGFIAAPAEVINAGLSKLGNNNASHEFYLTDLVAHAAAAGVEIAACPAAPEETIGVNTQADLARAERIFQTRQARRLLGEGVRLLDPSRFDLRGRCRFGRDCVVDVNVVLEGEVEVGDRCVIGPGSVIRDSRIGAGSVIEAHCVIDHADIGAKCRIGPFARLRPGAQLGIEARVGNFVEIKNSRLGRGSKANHLSYLGDSALGDGVNIGAGVITCNYDGANKHRTDIGDHVFVGSNSQLVAPLSIGDGATIGAGSTITEDVGAQALAVGRARQKTIRNWTRPAKRKPSAGE